MLGAIYPEMSAKYASDLKAAREALARDLAAGVDPEPSFKILRAVMEEVWASGYLVRPIVRSEYELAMQAILHNMPEQLYIESVQSATERNVERGGIGLGGILIGVGIGYLLFGRKKSKRG